MSDVFISYARSTEAQAKQIAEALRALGYGVWRDDELPAHRAYAEVIEERLKAARAVVVIWSEEAARSHWVQSEADTARTAHKLVQLNVDGARLPLPFDRIHCADLAGWSGDTSSPQWRTVVASIAELAGSPSPAPTPGPAADAPLPLPSKPSIAVMPFANLSGDAEQDYFADGMVEEIVTALSRIKSIFVIASASTLSFKGNAVPPQDAARLLGVRYVLEGSVRKAGGRVRITVKLIDATDGAQLWGDRFEGTLEDVFALQDEVALKVAGVIGPAVEESEVRRAFRRPTENMSSYDLYLRARALGNLYEKAETFEAIDLLDRAIALDPDYALAMAGAAYCHAQVVVTGWSDDKEHHRGQGVSLAKRALSIAADDAEVLCLVTGAYLPLGEDVDTSISLIDRSLKLNPGASQAWVMSGWLRVATGEVDLAVTHFETAMRLDPRSPHRHSVLTGIALARFDQGRFAEAATLLKESAQLKSGISLNQALLAACHGHLGHAEAARTAIDAYRRLSGVDVHERVVLFGRPEHRKLFLAGIALAEGRSPGEGSAG